MSRVTPENRHRVTDFTYTHARVEPGDKLMYREDARLLVGTELLATEGIMEPIRFLFMTPHHPKLTPLRVGEVYTGLRGQKRIKLVDDVGRVFHYDRDIVVCGGLPRTVK